MVYPKTDMHVLDPDLLKRIDSAKEELDQSKLEIFVQSLVDNVVKETLELAPIQDADNEGRKDEVIANYRAAWEYAITEDREFNLLFLTEVGGRVEPAFREMLRTFAKYRQQIVQLRGIDYCPPVDEARVREHLERVLKVLKNEDLHPVEEGMYLNFHLTRIQPFENGNKRTASVVMNTLLYQNGFPTVFVRPTERRTYATLLKNALQGFKEVEASQSDTAYRNLDFQQQGYMDFLGNKVLTALLAAQDQLKCVPHFTIHFSTSNPGTMYTAKKKIGAWFRAHGLISQEQLRPKERRMEVMGKIPYETLHSLLGPIRNLEYKIVSG